MKPLIQHIPHAVPVVIVWGLMLRFWLLQRRLRREEEGPLALAAPRSTGPSPSAAAAPSVRRAVATRGLLALGPLLGALATGLVIYAINLGRGHAGQTAIWVHVGLSLLALLLVAYKIAEIGAAGLRDSLARQRSWRAGGSLVLLVLWVPLLVSGVALLFFPSEASFTAYAHLIASVWWTGLLLWHLRRYLARATVAVFARPRSAGLNPAGSGADGLAARARPIAARSRDAAAVPVGVSPSGETEAAGGPAEDGAPAPISGR